MYSFIYSQDVQNEGHISVLHCSGASLFFINPSAQIFTAKYLCMTTLDSIKETMCVPVDISINEILSGKDIRVRLVLMTRSEQNVKF